jgi:parvulin-like peptidyl-prolyl isomerase
MAPAHVPPEKVLVKINGEPLSIDEFDSEFLMMRIHYSAVTERDMRAIKRRLFEQIIDRRILVQQARKDGVRLTRSEADAAWRDVPKDGPDSPGQVLKARGVSQESWKRKILQELLAHKVVEKEVDPEVRISDKEVEDYYWSHLPNYWTPEAVHARHLVVQKKSDLDRVMKSLARGDDFAKLASIFSLGPERSQGGDLGVMATDRLSPAYLSAMRPLKTGAISKPVKDVFGYHLFQLLEWLPRRMRSFPEVRAGIRVDLEREEKDQRFNEWMMGLKKASTIEVNKDMAPVVGVVWEE